MQYRSAVGVPAAGREQPWSFQRQHYTVTV